VENNKVENLLGKEKKLNTSDVFESRCVLNSSTNKKAILPTFCLYYVLIKCPVCHYLAAQNNHSFFF